ncbi:glycosyltransferase [Xenococcus sp. PCC 7305]|uniref:glycosyltransferase family 4 protein n=1 Tax=Xenococcus sp. PCC 7305 TaxID=102125 RepID=UPI0002AC5564|nr:glycosyltransferase family 4 protein [Xenococcus sp. PCC 7305]ELS03710.1 glycosyltransferase [Xenococcus sp. PCC 7305]
MVLSRYTKFITQFANKNALPINSAEQRRSITKTKKVLIFAHNHPHFSPGGAEIFAYDLFQALRDHTHYQPFFLAGTVAENRETHADTPFQILGDSPNETLFWGGDFDYFYQSQKLLNFMYLDFKNFLKELKPDVIHFHHTIRLGVEAIQIARQTLPEVKIVFTLHEFILMCLRDGQMVRKDNEELCEYASPERCHRCFPEHSPQKFKMREEFIKNHLRLVDQFISPSHFLAKRFVDWGIPQTKMQVLENGRKLQQPAPYRQKKSRYKRHAFGFFGQINPYKGVFLILEAVDYLVKNDFTDFKIELFGNIARGFPEFAAKFTEFLEKYPDIVTYHGEYKQEDMGNLMKLIDWAIVPSVWWENSPLVIQEVFMHKRPIICSDIGGMAEKVAHNINGLHFKARDAISLADTIKESASNRKLWDKLVKNIQPRLSIEESALEHTRIYDQALPLENREQVYK